MTFWYLLGYSLSKGIAKTFFNYQVIGAENIIEEGPCIIAANHASFFDPPLAGVACQRAIHYLARKSLLDWPVLGGILPELNVIPVDQKNADRSALMAAIRVVRAGGAILVFPEGTRSAGAPVVPMRIFGSFEAFPRNRKFPRSVTISVVVGKPLKFSPEEISKRDVYQKTSDRIMDAVARLEID